MSVCTFDAVLIASPRMVVIRSFTVDFNVDTRSITSVRIDSIFCCTTGFISPYFAVTFCFI